jgi:hypothetical protein
LNATSTRQSLSGNLPALMAASRGKLLIDLVELLSARVVPNKVRLGGSKKEVAEQLVQQYDGVLRHLKARALAPGR